MKSFRGGNFKKIKKGTDEFLLLLIFFLVSFALGFMAFGQNEILGKSQTTYISKNVKHQNFQILDKMRYELLPKNLA